jgi:hypothetical protein
MESSPKVTRVLQAAMTRTTPKQVAHVHVPQHDREIKPWARSSKLFESPAVTPPRPPPEPSPVQGPGARARQAATMVRDAHENKWGTVENKWDRERAGLREMLQQQPNVVVGTLPDGRQAVMVDTSWVATEELDETQEMRACGTLLSHAAESLAEIFAAGATDRISETRNAVQVAALRAVSLPSDTQFPPLCDALLY